MCVLYVSRGILKGKMLDRLNGSKPRKDWSDWAQKIMSNQMPKFVKKCQKIVKILVGDRRPCGRPRMGVWYSNINTFGFHVFPQTFVIVYYNFCHFYVNALLHKICIYAYNSRLWLAHRLIENFTRNNSFLWFLTISLSLLVLQAKICHFVWCIKTLCEKVEFDVVVQNWHFLLSCIPIKILI